ncbi:MAG: hypothetical protein WCF24_00990 [Acidimicrobiales bacterium]
MTLTYAEGAELDHVSDQIEQFWRRWRKATGSPLRPYAVVPEWGGIGDRLHLHVAIGWWSEFGAVEVCGACAREALYAMREVPVAGSLCIGCIWGLGFVGRPDVSRDGDAVARYISKYLAKQLISSLFGRQRYRVAKGFQPPEYRGAYATRDAAFAALMRKFDGEQPESSWTPEDARARDPQSGNGVSYYCEQYRWPR